MVPGNKTNVDTRSAPGKGNKGRSSATVKAADAAQVTSAGNQGQKRKSKALERQHDADPASSGQDEPYPPAKKGCFDLLQICCHIPTHVTIFVIRQILFLIPKLFL